MRKTVGLMLLVLTLAMPGTVFAKGNDLTEAFNKLSGTEAALRTLSKQIDKAVGSEATPDRVYAMQDMAGLCSSSKMQVHSLNSLFSLVNLVKREKVQDNQTAQLKKKCLYAFNDFTRRRAFVMDILKKAKDQRLRDLAHIFEAQLEIILEQLARIKANI